MERQYIRIGWYIVAAVLILVGMGALLLFSARFDILQTTESSMGVIILLTASALLVLLFIMASGFSSLRLADREQALGLPEGSIRAVIAVMLIMVFTVVGAYLFRNVSYGVGTAVLSGLSRAQFEQIPVDRLLQSELDANTNTYSVTTRVTVSPEGSRLADQLVTTLGTLVVAVAGFYFGTRAVAAARGAIEKAGPAPLIGRIEPNQSSGGDQGTDKVPVTIFGREFRSPKMVKLARGSTEIKGEDVLSSPDKTKINCKFQFAADTPAGKWDVIVVNDDGQEDKREGEFVVLPVITSFDPKTGTQAEKAKSLAIKGAHFVDKMKAKLSAANQTDIEATSVTFANATSITAVFDLSSKAIGTWTVVITTPDGVESKAADGFAIT